MRGIHGDSLLGFGDFFSDGVSDQESGAYGQADGISVGATPARRVPVKVPAGAKVPTKMPTSDGKKKVAANMKGNIPKRKARGKGQHSPHRAALANAAKAGQHAIKVANGAAKHIGKYQKALASGKHAPAVKLIALGFNMDGEVVLGVANPKLAKTLTPKQRMMVQRHTNAAARLSAANKALAVAAVNAKKKGEAAKAFVRQAIPFVKNALVVKPITGSTHVGAAQMYINQRGGVDKLTDDEVIGLTEILADGISGEQTEIGYLDQGFEGQSGQMTEIGYLDDGYEGESGEQTEIGQDYGPVDLPNAPEGEPAVPFDAAPPQQPGGNLPMTTTSPDSLSPADSGTGAVMDPQGNVIYDPATDPAVIPMPQRAVDLTPEEMTESWDHVPDDGFVYGATEGGKQYPPNSIGSANTFLDSVKNASGWGHGYIFGGQDWMYPSNDDFNTFEHGHFGSTSEIQGYSLQHGWGPITGNPTGPLKNLQYAQVDKKLFWQGKSAPLAYSAEADSKIAQANAATIAANRAAAVAQLKQMQADQAAQAEAQANQDAQNALAESAAESQMNVAAAQQQVQQGQIDLDTQKQQGLMAQQSAQIQAQAQQAMIEQSQQQAKVQAQAQQALIDQAATYNKWAADHPDEAAAQMQADEMAATADQGPMGDEGDDSQGGDDGSEDAPIEESDFPIDSDDAYSDHGDLGIRRNNDLIDAGDWE